MSNSALAYKQQFNLNEAASILADGGTGLNNFISLLREAVNLGALKTHALIRHTRYDWNLGGHVYDPAGFADVHQTIVERVSLVEWLEAINFMPRPALLFPDAIKAAVDLPDALAATNAPVPEIDAAVGTPSALVVEAPASESYEQARVVDALHGLIEVAALEIGSNASVASVSTMLFQWALDNAKPGRLLTNTADDTLRFKDGRFTKEVKEAALKQRIRRYLNRQDS